MTGTAAAAPGSRVGPPLAAGWGIALRRGLLAFGVMAGLAEGAALAVFALGGTGLSLLAFLRVGGFYLASFHHVPLRLSAGDLDVSRLTAALDGTATSAAVHAELLVTPLAATALAAWLLFRGGRAVAERAGGGPVARALHGMKVAPFYALAVLLVCFAVRLRWPVPNGSLVSGTIELSAAPLFGLLRPLALGVVAGAAGGLWSSDRARGVRAVLAGGWTMLVLGLALSYTGLFVAGVVRPDGAEALLTPSTGRYFQTVFGRAGTGAVVVAHHLALAPNEAAWALVPAMGGCTGLVPAEGEATDALCYGHFPTDVALPSWLAPPPATAGPVARTRFDTAPAPYFAFLLVPAVAGLLAGGRVARRMAEEPVGTAALLGAGAGLVFAVLVVVVGCLSSVGASGSLALDGVVRASGSVRIGPGLVSGGLLALGWGVAGGAAGAAVTTRYRMPRP